jgi:hypothetical protein
MEIEERGKKIDQPEQKIGDESTESANGQSECRNPEELGARREIALLKKARSSTGFSVIGHFRRTSSHGDRKGGSAARWDERALELVRRCTVLTIRGQGREYEYPAQLDYRSKEVSSRVHFLLDKA